MMVKVSQEHVDARRQQILTAALHCFAQEGYQKTTMQDVARKAGLSAGSLYNYFESKEAMVEALAQLSADKMGSLIAELRERGPLGEALESLAAGWAETLNAPGGRSVARFNVVLWAEALSSEPLQKRLAGVDCAMLETITRVVEEGRSQGEIAADLEPARVAEAVLIYMSGLILRTALDADFDPAAHWSQIGARLIGGGRWS